MSHFPFATIDYPVFLAPMEDVTDASFRRICKDFGADVLISEFVSSDALVREVDKSLKKMAFSESERPFGIQIFGHDEQSLRGAAEIAAARQPDFIDINWGCPVKKVVAKGAGAAMLRDIPKLVRLTEGIVKAVPLPVTVKTRLGWDELHKPIVDLAEMLQDVGVRMLTVHGRTRSQMYSGQADWTLIGEIKRNPRITIPIVGNGDVDGGERALEVRNLYGVDGVMVGRAAIGNPFVFKEIKNFFEGKERSEFSFADRVSTCLRQLQTAVEIKGERTGVLEMRRHYAGYFKGIPHFKETRVKLMTALTLAECQSILLNSMEHFAKH